MAYVKKVIGNGGGARERGRERGRRGESDNLCLFMGAYAARISVYVCACVCAHACARTCLYILYMIYVYECMGKTCICTLWVL